MGEKVWKKGKCFKIPLLKTKMASYSILYCSVRYLSAVIISDLNAATLKFRSYIYGFDQNGWQCKLASLKVQNCSFSNFAKASKRQNTKQLLSFKELKNT